MSKPQHSRGRAERRHQALVHKRHHRAEIPVKWSKLHRDYRNGQLKDYVDAKFRGDFGGADEWWDDIAREAEIEIGPGLKRLPKTEDQTRRERVWQARADKALERLTMRYRMEREARQKAHLTEYAPENLRTWKDF